MSHSSSVEIVVDRVEAAFSLLNPCHHRRQSPPRSENGPVPTLPSFPKKAKATKRARALFLTATSKAPPQFTLLLTPKRVNQKNETSCFLGVKYTCELSLHRANERSQTVHTAVTT